MQNSFLPECLSVTLSERKFLFLVHKWCLTIENIFFICAQTPICVAFECSIGGIFLQARRFSARIQTWFWFFIFPGLFFIFPLVYLLFFAAHCFLFLLSCLNRLNSCLTLCIFGIIFSAQLLFDDKTTRNCATKFLNLQNTATKATGRKDKRIHYLANVQLYMYQCANAAETRRQGVVSRMT
jgi:hypothetical protein